MQEYEAMLLKSRLLLESGGSQPTRWRVNACAQPCSRSTFDVSDAPQVYNGAVEGKALQAFVTDAMPSFAFALAASSLNAFMSAPASDGSLLTTKVGLHVKHSCSGMGHWLSASSVRVVDTQLGSLHTLSVQLRSGWQAVWSCQRCSWRDCQSHILDPEVEV